MFDDGLGFYAFRPLSTVMYGISSLNRSRRMANRRNVITIGNRKRTIGSIREAAKSIAAQTAAAPSKRIVLAFDAVPGILKCFEYNSPFMVGT